MVGVSGPCQMLRIADFCTVILAGSEVGVALNRANSLKFQVARVESVSP